MGHPRGVVGEIRDATDRICRDEEHVKAELSSIADRLGWLAGEMRKMSRGSALIEDWADELVGMVP